ncbi:uncharacterized protein EI90DRAFT_2604988 [Cantharellus anzutake]|uniref:uncharacterized protein n=1 Tax=Cantharellus anzutake TaxID=1750568 RepID=UPI0019059205|nr:uncharacterized protein EI90DRAFT_2604988 [Cantharellus anzutake]KAF8320596.1 hypothetical protein EI90DRAFT_2604988 [Cantharellus anzutake]
MRPKLRVVRRTLRGKQKWNEVNDPHSIFHHVRGNWSLTELSRQSNNKMAQRLKQTSQLSLHTGSLAPQARATDARSKAVHLPEILIYVFQECDKRTLTSCARVCKTWNTYSVRPLWKNINAQQAIFRPLWPNRWSTEEHSLLRGILRCAEWTEQLHINITEEHLNGPPQLWAVRYKTVAEFILIAPLFRQPHFPRLTELIYDCHSSALRALPYWLSPGLLKLELRVNETDDLASLILRTLHEHTPRLTSLSVCFGDVSIDPASYDLSSMLNALTQLEVFKAHPSLIFKPFMWKELASLPNLRLMETRYRFEHLPKERYWHVGTLEDVDDPFPTLECIDGKIPQDLVPEVFGMRGIFKLRHLKIWVLDAPSELTIQTIFQTIPAYYNQLETFSVKLSAWESPRHDLTTFVFEHLKTFSLWTPKSFVIAPDAFVEFTQRHPSLLSLTLDCEEWSTETGITPDVVSRILEACPSLRLLQIGLQGKRYAMRLIDKEIQKLRAEHGLQLDVKQA